MDLRPLYALIEKGPSAQKHGVKPSVRKQRAGAILKGLKNVKDAAQRRVLSALAQAIEDGEAQLACTLFDKLNAEGRKALPRNLAVACGEGRYIDLWQMYELVG